MKLESKSLEILAEGLKRLESGFSHLPDVNFNYDYEAMKKILLEVADELHKDYPYFHPYYIGHMTKQPHPMARLAYMLALWVNPNNHSFDSSHASSPMEQRSSQGNSPDVWLADLFGPSVRRRNNSKYGGTLGLGEAES